MIVTTEHTDARAAANSELLLSDGPDVRLDTSLEVLLVRASADDSRGPQKFRHV
jgi:hypothetical protein